MISEKNPQVKKAVVRLMELSNDERTRLLYESRQKMEWDILARERGALKEQALNIAKNLLRVGDAVDKIINVTGLTHEEIESLQNAD